jgi:hypothetical protein
VLIFVRAQLVLNVSPLSGCPFLGEDVQTGAPNYPSRLKDSDFSLPNKFLLELK